MAEIDKKWLRDHAPFRVFEGRDPRGAAIYRRHDYGVGGGELVAEFGSIDEARTVCELMNSAATSASSPAP